MEVRISEPMSAHTSFKTGGNAAWYAVPETKKELWALLSVCQKTGTPWYVVGNGSNLLVSSQGFPGLIISMAGFDRLEADGETVLAGGGVLLSKTANFALKHGLTGLEFAAGIPGTVGGAAVMNAGAYGGEMKDVILEAVVLAPDGRILTLKNAELAFGYRTSCIPENGYIVLEVRYGLSKGEPEAIKARMEELAARRREKQPLQYPSAGSTFKRPQGDFAGRLIEEAGLKGFSVGGAAVSEKHAGFVINRGGATAEEIYGLCMEVKRRVKECSGVELELEVKLLGAFGGQNTAEKD